MEKLLNQLRNLITFHDAPVIAFGKSYDDGNPAYYSITLIIDSTTRETKLYEKKIDAFNEAASIINEIKNNPFQQSTNYC